MAVPILGSVEPDVDVVGSFHQFIGKARSAAGTEDHAGGPKSRIDILVPPTLVTKFYDVAMTRIQLLQDSFEKCRVVSNTGRQLKQETTHTFPKQICDITEIKYQGFGLIKTPNMSDKFANLDRVNKVAGRLAQPGLHCRNRGPSIKRCIELRRRMPTAQAADQKCEYRDALRTGTS